LDKRCFGGAYDGKRVLVTGHTGFKGAWLSQWLIDLGAEVWGYSNNIPTTPSLFEAIGLETRMHHVLGDIRDLDRFRAVVQDCRPDFVLHLAAQAIVSESYRDPLETISSNVLGTACVLDVLRKCEVSCTVLVVTSDKCYENIEQPWGYREIDPLGGKDIYSASKGAAEIIAHSYHKSFFNKSDSPVRLVTARAGNVLGGGDWAADRIVADCVRAWLDGKKVQLRRPSSTRPWQHVMEPLSGYLTLTASAARNIVLNGESFNFGPHSERARTVLELLGDLARIWGFEDGRNAYDALPAPPFAEAGLLKLSCDKASMALHWEANLTYDECVQMTGSWYRAVLKDREDALDTTRQQIADYVDKAVQREHAWAVGAL